MAGVIPKPFSGQTECLISAGLKSRILLPTDTEYTARLASYFSVGARLRPACILQPRSAQEVAQAVTALANAGQAFAVRSGGCTVWAGCNNIADGVTIDLGEMNSTVFDMRTETVHIEAGTRWKDVYAELVKYDRVVAGGREPDVGVAGFLLGGGNTFFTGRYGFACDNVTAYEVVLADGRIVTVDASQHEDLFRVLKGGGGNFGIVTRFTMRAIPCGTMWGGLALLPMDTMPAAAEALVDFTSNISKDPDSSMLCVYGYMPAFQAPLIANLYANVAAVEKPPAFDKFLALPEIMNTYKKTTMLDIILNASLPKDYRNVWFAISVKNDVSIVTKATELQAELLKEMQAHISDGDFVAQCIFQPLPRVIAQASVAAGGNIMGLERYEHDGLMVQYIFMVRTPELEAWLRPRLHAMVDAVRAFAAGVEGGGLLPWVYLNYADPSQEALQSYGPENIRKMREAAAKYDPNGVFQRLCPGGFKISAVKN